MLGSVGGPGAKVYEWDWCCCLAGRPGTWVFGEIGCLLCCLSPIRELPGQGELSWHCTMHFWRRGNTDKMKLSSSVSLQCTSSQFCAPVCQTFSSGCQCSYESIFVNVWLSKWYFSGSMRAGTFYPSILVISLYFVLFLSCQIIFNICMPYFAPNRHILVSILVWI